MGNISKKHDVVKASALTARRVAVAALTQAALAAQS